MAKQLLWIPDMIDPEWKVIFFDLATLAPRPILQNSPMRTFIAPCSHYRYQYLRSPSSANNTPRLRPTVCTSPSWMIFPYYTVSEIQCLTTLPNTTLKSVGDSSPPLGGATGCLELGAMITTLSCGTSWLAQKSTRMPRSFGTAP